MRRWRGLAHRLDHSVSLSVAQCNEVELRRHELGIVPWAPHRGRQLTTAQRAVEKVGGENRGLPPEGSAWFPSHKLGLLLAQRTFGEERGVVPALSNFANTAELVPRGSDVGDV